jgi:2,5-dioxopentanoate dehydrogenase
MFLRISKKNFIQKTRNIHGKNLIGGSLSSLGTEKISSRNNNVSIKEATKEEIEKAMKLAEEAKLIFRKMENKKVVEFLQTIKKLLSQREEPILAIATNETGLAKARLGGEFQRTLNQIQGFSDALLDGSFTETRIHIQPGKPDLVSFYFTLNVKEKNVDSYWTSCCFWCF